MVSGLIGSDMSLGSFLMSSCQHTASVGVKGGQVYVANFFVRERELPCVFNQDRSQQFVLLNARMHVEHEHVS